MSSFGERLQEQIAAAAAAAQARTQLLNTEAVRWCTHVLHAYELPLLVSGGTLTDVELIDGWNPDYMVLENLLIPKENVKISFTPVYSTRTEYGWFGTSRTHISYSVSMRVSRTEPSQQ